MTIGIDEVGRGCWAGPLVAAAVCWSSPGGPNSELQSQLADSKQLSAARRQSVFQLIRPQARIGLGWVSPESIDDYGLSQAQTQAMEQALVSLGPDLKLEPVIIDGSVNYLPDHPASQTQVRADSTIPTVIAAGIAAKVVRDHFCQLLDCLYPGWGLSNHKGYGTAEHRQALTARQPITGLHRFSYRPVAEAYQTWVRSVAGR